jgi:hypothetical protein
MCHCYGIKHAGQAGEICSFARGWPKTPPWRCSSTVSARRCSGVGQMDFSQLPMRPRQCRSRSASTRP